MTLARPSHGPLPDLPVQWWRSLMTTPTGITSIIGHAEIAAFANSNINLQHSKVIEYPERVNSLRDSLRAKIAADPAYAVVRVLDAGSLAKGTALRNTSDFDLAVYLRPGAVPETQRSSHTWLVARLKEARPQLEDDQFELRDHCVSLVYKDGRRVDIVPILNAGDGSGDGDLIRKDTGAKVHTNVRRHIEFVRVRKARCPVHYPQVIRLLKWWAVQQQGRDKNFSLQELLRRAALLASARHRHRLLVVLERTRQHIQPHPGHGPDHADHLEDYYQRSAVPDRCTDHHGDRRRQPGEQRHPRLHRDQPPRHRQCRRRRTRRH